ncbi:hypothetical protein [Streptomyces lateritius]|uniref:hypothetical protein n=1 Tax=Streptomyces lateritius TaxID=67313 RepID=UPI00167A2E58|nr:hypothetical protein [Streptomyces lateritius]GGU12485.1 hypothetical protein GCM10010272_67030 [Streptomyces lateritius]
MIDRIEKGKPPTEIPRAVVDAAAGLDDPPGLAHGREHAGKLSRRENGRPRTRRTRLLRHLAKEA